MGKHKDKPIRYRQGVKENYTVASSKILSLINFNVLSFDKS